MRGDSWSPAVRVGILEWFSCINFCFKYHIICDSNYTTTVTHSLVVLALWNVLRDNLEERSL